ncbi:MAG TPA: RpiB/LacA/LacB family sugar-phosphate isomerase [Polyangiaceae bacterium]
MKSRENDDTGGVQALARRDELVANGKNATGRTKLVGIAGDHGGFELKQYLTERLRKAGYQVVDFGSRGLTPDDDYPDFVVPLARAVARAEVFRRSPRGPAPFTNKSKIVKAQTRPGRRTAYANLSVTSCGAIESRLPTNGARRGR